MRRTVLAVALLLAAIPAFARLPKSVVPSHYALTITPDLANETFAGDETIEVEVKEPVDTIVLNAVALDLTNVTINGQPATVTVDAPAQTVTLKVAAPLAVGKATIRDHFSAKLDQKLRGLYVSRTPRRKYAVTQFESTDARRAFPSFDEPAYKAVYDITLVVDAGDTAISNAPIAADTPAANGKHAIRFAPTKKMSTYLVAMLVGDFKCIDGAADGIPIRVCSTPGMENLGRFALSAAEATVKFYDGYFGIKYPFGKLDLIGIPDFEAGAMENAGAITFRETALLLDDKTASVERQKAVASNHETESQGWLPYRNLWWSVTWSAVRGRPAQTSSGTVPARISLRKASYCE